MKQTLLLIAAMALVGCGKETTPSATENKTERKVSVKKPIPAEPTPAEKAAAEKAVAEKAVAEKAVAEKAAAEKAAATKKAADEAQANAFVNTLGMKFVPVPGTEVQFCIWETRVKDYAAYAAANAGVNGWWKKPAFKQEETHPVLKVNWYEAQGFCAWLTKKELVEGKIKAGQKYRLPTDAEWSMAVGLGKEKGKTPEEREEGNKGIYPWGKEWPPPKGAGNYEGRLKVDKFEYTAPVGSFAANQHGLHDLGGNVWEWCEDKWNPTDDTWRTLRGGAACKSAPYATISDSDLLSSRRGTNFPADRLNYLSGFRCVLAAE